MMRYRRAEPRWAGIRRGMPGTRGRSPGGWRTWASGGASRPAGALDLFRGEMTREHEDLEIAVPAARFGLIRAALAGFDIEVVGSGRRWPLDSPAFDVMIQTWVRERDTGVYRPGIFREPHDGDTWICRRDRSIRLPYEQVIATSPEGSRTWCRRSCCCSRPSTTGPGTGPASPACCRC